MTLPSGREAFHLRDERRPSVRERLTGRKVGWNRYEAVSTLRIPPTRQLISNQHMSIQKNKQVSFWPQEVSL